MNNPGIIMLAFVIQELYLVHSILIEASVILDPTLIPHAVLDMRLLLLTADSGPAAPPKWFTCTPTDTCPRHLLACKVPQHSSVNHSFYPVMVNDIILVKLSFC